MPLDEPTRRFAAHVQRELRRLDERLEQHRARGEAVRLDSVTRIATWETRRGDVTARQYGEVLATYAPRDRLLRWAWVGGSHVASATHAETIARVGEARGVPQLSMSLVADIERGDAETLARLGAVVAGAEGLLVRSVGSELQFVGLFERSRPDASADRYSVPPPPVAEPGARASGASRTRATGGAAPFARVREPSRARFVPVASGAMSVLARSFPRYRQGLFVVAVEPSPHPEAALRVAVQLVALDEAGALRAVEPPEELVDAAREMTLAERREGNGLWRRLSARIHPKPDGGATLHVDVV